MSDLSLKILGSVSPYCKDDKNCPGYLIKYDNQNILFDCGNGCTRLLNMQEDLKDLKIFITHLHPDHIGDLTSLLQVIRVYKRHGIGLGNVELYMPEMFEDVYDYESDEGGWIKYAVGKKHSPEYSYIKRYANYAGVELKKIERRMEINNGVVEAKGTIHDIESYALKLTTPNGVISYSGDTSEAIFHESEEFLFLYKFVEDSDIFICESTFLKSEAKQGTCHLYASEAADIAKRAFVRKLILTHFWPGTDKSLYVAEAKKVFDNVEAAEEGKQYIIKR